MIYLSQCTYIIISFYFHKPIIFILKINVNVYNLIRFFKQNKIKKSKCNVKL
jgi:hypothetical protein